MPDYNPFDGSTQSAFNMAMAYLERVNRLLYIADEHKAKRELRLWFDILRVVCGEVKIKFKQIELDDLKIKEEAIKNFFLNHPGIDNGDFIEFNLGGGRTISQPNYPNERELLFQMLDEFEFTMKKLADKYDMFLPNKEDPRFAVLRR